MRDDLGLFYFPEPGNRKTRVYVRPGADGEPEFRLWQEDEPEIWRRHPWLGAEAIAQAADMYRALRGEGQKPGRLYDQAVARALLAEKARDEPA